VKNPARGGGRWIEVAPDRLGTWVDSFAARHPGVSVTMTADGATFLAGDGTVAECHAPFPPLNDRVPSGPDGSSESDESGESGDVTVTVSGAAELIASHANAARTVGVLLVRLGGFAAGVFTGSPPRLAASKVGSRLVHGRSAAGGTSQHRFARRREKQSAEALSAAAGNAAKVLGPYRDALDAVVLGGDRRATAALREDVRLAHYFALATDRFLTVPDPRLTVLRDTPRQFLAVRIRLTETTETNDTTGDER
jgi:Actinobacteria/chloroflexi VLRF1 release factor